MLQYSQNNHIERNPLSHAKGAICMEHNFHLLTEKEEMWAKMLMQVLSDNGIPCISQPVFGAGLVVRSGMQERLKVFVPSEKLQHASELLQELFSGET
jgi:hypothetical protein